jgi:uncharacterized protein
MKNYARALMVLACLSLGTFPLTPAAAAGHPVAAHATAVTRIVVQVSDADPHKWNLALNNAGNIQQALGARHTVIEVVAYGPGIGMLKKDSPVASRVTDASLAGIQFKACQNTMRAMHLTKADMVEEAGYVPSGVVEIVRRQQQGYAYIRP